MIAKTQARVTFEVREPQLYQLRAIAAQGKFLGDASKELGVARATLAAAIRRSPYREELVRLFPRMAAGSKPRGRQGMNTITIQELRSDPLVIDCSQLNIRMATTIWGAYEH